MKKKEKAVFVSSGEAACLLGISRATIQRYVDGGKLAGVPNPITKIRAISLARVIKFGAEHGIKITDKEIAKCVGITRRWNFDKDTATEE